MTDGIDNLFAPPKQDEIITLNSTMPQQEVVQQDFMSKPQQEVGGEDQNAMDITQTQTKMFMGDLSGTASREVNRNEAENLNVLNINEAIHTDYTTLNIAELLARNNPELQKPVQKRRLALGEADREMELSQAKRDAEVKKLREEREKELEQERLEKLERDALIQKEEEEAEEEERIKRTSKVSQESALQYKQELEKERLEKERLAAEDKERSMQADKAKFEAGIDSRPGSCERRRRNKKIAAAKKIIDTDVGVTHLTVDISSNLEKYKRSDGLQRGVAQQEMMGIAQQRRDLEREKRQKKEEERASREARKAKTAQAAGKTYVSKPVEKLKPIEDGMTDEEQLLISLVDWAPIKITSQIASPNEATRAVVFKTLIDRAITYKVDPEMISSVGLVSQIGDIRLLTRNVDIVANMLRKDPKAAALIDGQKLELFKSMESMLPALEKGLKQGLRLNGLDETGNAYYYGKDLDVKADKQEAMGQWAEAQQELQERSQVHKKKMDEYAKQSQEGWSRHEKFSLRTHTETSTHRLGIDTAGVNMVEGTKAHSEERAEAFAKLNKMGRLGNVHSSVQNVVVGLLPANATQEEADAHINQFKQGNTKAAVKKFVGDFLKTPLPRNMFTYENMGQPGKMQEMLLLKDKIVAISTLPNLYKEEFAEMPESIVKLILSAKQIGDVISQEIKFFEALYATDPSGTLDQTLKLSNSVTGSQKIYTDFWNNLINGASRAKELNTK